MESVRSGLRNIFADLIRGTSLDQAVMLAWPIVCGKEVANRTDPVGFSKGVLTVDVPDATWRGQLSAFSRKYVSGFNELLGPVVTDVKFKVKQQ
jgi:hypothetical protein